MADEVRNALVRMVIMIACTLLGGMVVTAARFADSWFSAPSLLVTLVLVVATVWSVLDVFVARQIHAEHVARGERCPFDP